MPKFGSLGKFFGRTVSEGAAYAAGVATAPTLTPVVEELRQTTWAHTVNSLGVSKRIDPETAAAIVAEDVELQAWGAAEAAHEGFSADRFAALLGEALNAPGLGELYSLWRRGEIDDAGFVHGLRKAKLEPRWDKPLKALKSARYSPAEIALGVVRSVLRDPGWLVQPLDTSDSNVPQYKPLDLDPAAEAAASGMDSERMRGLVGEIGLPMAVVAAAQSFFRGILTRGAFNQAVLEGDVRPEWADAYLEYARQIASASDYVNARIRGWITDAEMYAGTARHGMSEADTHLLYLIHGRPAAPGQMAAAAVRGIDGPDGRPMDREQFLKGIAESDIRPEWGPMLWESRFLYLPAFQLSRLVTSGAISPETGREWAIKERYAPEVCDALYKSWTTGGGSTAKTLTVADWQTLYESGRKSEPETLAGLEALGYPPGEAQAKIDAVHARRVDSEVGKALTDLRKAYLKDNLPEDVARIALAQLGQPAWAVDRIFAIWDSQKQFDYSVP